MKVAFWGLLALLGSPIAGQVRHAIIAPSVREALGAIADTATVEHARCIVGYVRNDSLFLDGIAVVQIYEQHRKMVSWNWRACPAATYAVWHNHIAEPGDNPRDRCFISFPDANVLIRSWFHVAIVHVNAQTHCWFVKRSDNTIDEIPYLDPKPGPKPPS